MSQREGHKVGADRPIGADAPAPESADRPTAAGLYRTIAPDLMRFATSLVGADEATDTVSQAVVKALSARDLTTLDHPRAYLFRAVYNESMSWRRRLARQRDILQRASARTATDPSGGARDLPEPPDQPVLDAVASLPVQQRAAIFLTYWADYTPDTVAAHLGISEGAVKKYLARARATLRERLGP